MTMRSEADFGAMSWRVFDGSVLFGRRGHPKGPRSGDSGRVGRLSQRVQQGVKMDPRPVVEDWTKATRIIRHEEDTSRTLGSEDVCQHPEGQPGVGIFLKGDVAYRTRRGVIPWPSTTSRNASPGTASAAVSWKPGSRGFLSGASDRLEAVRL
jgi:hypothetical protein